MKLKEYETKPPSNRTVHPLRRRPQLKRWRSLETQWSHTRLYLTARFREPLVWNGSTRQLLSMNWVTLSCIRCFCSMLWPKNNWSIMVIHGQTHPREVGLYFPNSNLTRWWTITTLVSEAVRDVKRHILWMSSICQWRRRFVSSILVVSGMRDTIKQLRKSIRAVRTTSAPAAVVPILITLLMASTDLIIAIITSKPYLLNPRLKPGITAYMVSTAKWYETCFDSIDLIVIIIKCYTTHGLELTRVTVVNAKQQTIYETLVKPSNTILDYNSKFSGIKESDLRSVTTTIADVQRRLQALFNDKTILIGHSLESDLKALKIIHNTVVDTAQVYPHKRGLPFKRALRTLTAEFLKKIIQDDGMFIFIIFWQIV